MPHDETQKVGTASEEVRDQWRVLRTNLDDELDDPVGEPQEATTDRKMKRLNLNLPAPVFTELQALAKASGRSMTDLIRFALGLLHFVFTETRANRKLAVTDSRGRVLKEVVLPW